MTIKFVLICVSLNEPQDGVECEFLVPFLLICFYLLVYEKKYYLQVYLNNSAYKIVNTEMVGYLDNNIFDSDLFFESYKCCIIIELIK